MRLIAAFVLVLAICPSLAKAEQAAGAAPSPAPSDNGDLYQSAKQLFDQYAPPEVKAQYEFPSKEQFDDFMGRLDKTMDSGTLAEMAGYAPQARTILAALRTQPGYSDVADWLAARLEEIEEAKQIEDAAAAPPPAVSAPVIRSPDAAATESAIPYYDRWLQRMRARPMPANAAELMPELRRAFADEGMPPELAWLAEVESSLNPSARSPSGARGLYQMKEGTARDFGLSTFLPDERTDPGKSAHAAARDLRALEEKFGSWPLALAAYNAGEGRVSRALAARHTHDFAGVASALPAGTRLYVPEVCALVTVRTGVTPDKIPPPK
jgi:membrane-bound lytic murein transglycosylase D